MEREFLYQPIYEAVSDIALADFTNMPQLNSPGIFDGLVGLALFYFEWYQFTQQDIFLEKSLNLIQQAYQKIDYYNLTLSHGTTGIMWLIHYLRESDILDESWDELLEKYDNTLNRLLKEILGDLDPMHGGLSVANYMSWRGSSENLKGLHLVVDALYAAKIKMGHGIAWNNSRDNELLNTIQHINFGMAHGIPAILCFLTRIKKIGIQREKCDEMLAEGTAYLLSLYDPASPSFFPHRIQRGITTRKSTLSYCYGDLGISPGLAAVAKSTNNSILFEIVRHAAVRMARISLLYPTANDDISLCHGAGGNAYIFLKLHDILGEGVLLEAGLAQYQLSLDLRKQKGGIAGFFSLDHSPERGFYFRSNPGFIQGVAGMGLSMIALLAKKPHNQWDKILYLS